MTTTLFGKFKPDLVIPANAGIQRLVPGFCRGDRMVESQYELGEQGTTSLC